MTERPHDAIDRPIPPTELAQPDPQLSLSSGRASPLQIIATLFGCLVILAVTIYGLNRPMNEATQSAAAPAAQETTGAAPQNEQPAPSEPAASPAAQPQPEPQKAAQPDDSARGSSPAQ